MRSAVRCFLGLSTLAATASVLSCRSATQISIVVHTDFDCADLNEVTIAAGTLGPSLETTPPSAASSTCGAGGYAGTLVAIPSGAQNEEVAFKIVGGFGRGTSADSCTPTFDDAGTPEYGSGCIVARRALRYIPGSSLSVDVVLHASCAGIPCGDTETCASGECVPATLPDPSACTGSGCGDGALEDGGSPAYGAITNATLWSLFDVHALDGYAQEYEGSAFDGRYLYLVPGGASGRGIAVRFDTLSSFTSAGAWGEFDTTALSSAAWGFSGGVFDGRFVYYVPGLQLGTTPSGLAARFDTRTSFADASSWATFDTTSLNAGAKGFYGGAFDGRYVYFVPSSNGATSGLVARFDSQGTFGSAGSWSTFDTTTVTPGAGSFLGAVFDGRYLYFIPGNDPGDQVTRLDTQAPFGSVSSWSVFDTSTLTPAVGYFSTGAFDGRYVYFVPTDAAGTFTRFDTQGPFTAASSWTTFAATQVSPDAQKFSGAGFDGRFLYFTPPQVQSSSSASIVTSYDTLAPFSSVASWSAFDTTALGANVFGFSGAAFDGSNVYLVPGSASIVARFQAKTPRSLPPGYSGSFY